jgi:hypothetical protein
MMLSLVSANLGGFTPLSALDLQQLQAAQFKHDEVYHREIARLPVQRRLTHMTLHFAKYCGRLLAQEANEQQTIADIFAITLSSANILSLPLAKLLDAEARRSHNSSFVHDLGIATGKMSAACEKLDHLEDFPYRQVLRESVSDIAHATMNYCGTKNWDLKGMVTTRLESVRGKVFLPSNVC